MEERVYFWHLKALGYCNRQMRKWCKSKDISWRSLINDGILAEELLSIDSTSYAINAVEFARSTGWSKDPIEKDSILNERCL